MTPYRIIVALLALLLYSCNATQQVVRGSTITVTAHASNNEWWLAYSVSDPSTTAVELKDSGSYAANWNALSSSNWGYWVFNTNGAAVTFPVSLRLSAGSEQLTLENVFSSAAPGQTVDTQKSFSSSPSGAPSPTQAPSTSAPTETPAPTQAPSTPAPSQSPTQAPSTPAPTQAPTKAPTQAPSKAPTQSPPSSTTPPPAPVSPNPPDSTPATSAPTQAPSNGGSGPTSNPFSGTQYYINSHYTAEVDSSIASNPSVSAQLTKVKGFASAFWIDRMAVIANLSDTLQEAQSQASNSKVMASIVIYDLPARDCSAAASNGEISCADATCADGIATYKTQYIDPIVEVLKQFPDLVITAIIEPDSLPNLATNLAVAKCQLAQTAYKTGVAYAISQLSTLSNVYMYVDAAHGGWLGWDTNRADAVTIFQEVLTQAGGASKIRGFATNVANYQPLGSMTSTDDPCNLGSQSNNAINEVKYVSLLDQSLTAAGITGMHYIIDTGRNGVPNSRTDCSNWCNIKNSGLGVPPTSDTGSSGLSNIDAYFWVKPPGESDGTSDSSAARFDFHCASADSMTPAPEAGQWFSALFVSQAEKANPSL